MMSCFARSRRDIITPLIVWISATAIESELSITQSVRSHPESRLSKNPILIKIIPNIIKIKRISPRRGEIKKLDGTAFII